MNLKSRIYIKHSITTKLETNFKQNEKWNKWFQTETMGNQIEKSLKMPSDVNRMAWCSSWEREFVQLDDGKG